jgi:hypothetical protein
LDASFIFGKENLDSSRRLGLISFSALAAVVLCSPMAVSVSDPSLSCLGSYRAIYSE